MLFISLIYEDYVFPFVTTETMMTCLVVTVSVTQKNKDVTTETPPNVSIVKIFDTFEPSSKMLISTWFDSTVLNSNTHRKTKCYGITPKKVCLIAEKMVFGNDVP